MKKKIRSLAAVLLALIILSGFAVCAFADNEDAALDAQEPEILGEWKVGATKKDDITATWSDGTLWLEGTGRMKDFAKLSDRPWNDIIGSIRFVMIGDEIENIGKNAFAGLGADFTEEGQTADFFLPVTGKLTVIGENAFANSRLYWLTTIPSSVTEIKSKAFEKSGLAEIHFDGAQPKIAADAFSGCDGILYTPYNTGWDTTQSFGGSFEHKALYSFTVYRYHDNEEVGRETIMYPEGESIDYFAESYDDEFGFDHYRVVKGNFSLADPKNPLIDKPISDNVEIDVFYKKGNEPVSRPEPEKEPCPLVITKDGQPALDDVDGDYYWQPEANTVLLLKSGLTISMPEGMEGVHTSISSDFKEPTEITFENLSIRGEDIFVSMFSSDDIKINLVGENKIISADSQVIGLPFIAGAQITFAGKGSLYLEAYGEGNTAAFCMKEFVLDGFTISGADSADAEKLKEVQFKLNEDAGEYGYYLKENGNEAKVLMIQPQPVKIIKNPVLPIIIVVIIIAAIVVVRKVRQ